MLESFREALAELYGPELDRVVLFGFRARGDARDDSDYDVAVFLKDTGDKDPRPLGRVGSTGGPSGQVPRCGRPFHRRHSIPRIRQQQAHTSDARDQERRHDTVKPETAQFVKFACGMLRRANRMSSIHPDAGRAATLLPCRSGGHLRTKAGR